MRAFLLAAILVLAPVVAFADLAISGQDGKQVRPGDGIPMKPTPDSVAAIEFSSTKAPRIIGLLEVCSTQMGPPSAIAVAPDYSFALATCPQKIGPDNKTSPQNLVSVIGLDDPTHPKLLQTVQAGMGATGVYLDKKLRYALVTGTGDDTITLFTIKDRTLTQASQVKLEAKAEPRDVIIAPGGKIAYALRFGDGKVTKLAINGDQLTRVTDFMVGVNPDGGSLTHDGRYLIVNNFGGYTTTAKGSAATTVTDTRTGKVTYAVEVGALPEAVVLSPDGKYVALVIGNGSATVKTAANYNSVFGKLSIFKVGAGKLDHVADAQLGHACQGAVWSDDQKRLLVQCSVERDIRVFDFDGKTLTERPEAALQMVSRPGAMVTSKTR
ncbi:MAG: beta-propeller fold lactonase family protein [Alphaproteobacteria bacterium]|nr:beta-propeller fold lactonase family protein [Alphaproteobacteria bacterium]